MVYYTSLGFSDNRVACAVAQLLLIDARVNHLGMAGFPAVICRLVENRFLVTFICEGRVSDALELSIQEARRLIEHFQKEQLNSTNESEIFYKIQDIIAKFEGERNTT